jgi:hypothetical protein
MTLPAIADRLDRWQCCATAREHMKMDDDQDQQRQPVPRRRPYVAPVLTRLGSLKDLTRTVGHQGAKDGQQTGNQKRTSW